MRKNPDYIPHVAVLTIYKTKSCYRDSLIELHFVLLKRPFGE